MELILFIILTHNSHDHRKDPEIWLAFVRDSRCEGSWFEVRGSSCTSLRCMRRILSELASELSLFLVNHSYVHARTRTQVSATRVMRRLAANWLLRLLLIPLPSPPPPPPLHAILQINLILPLFLFFISVL